MTSVVTAEKPATTPNPPLSSAGLSLESFVQQKAELVPHNPHEAVLVPTDSKYT